MCAFLLSTWVVASNSYAWGRLSHQPQRKIQMREVIYRKMIVKAECNTVTLKF